jgi:hypothetical protein
LSANPRDAMSTVDSPFDQSIPDATKETREEHRSRVRSYKLPSP